MGLLEVGGITGLKAGIISPALDQIVRLNKILKPIVGMDLTLVVYHQVKHCWTTFILFNNDDVGTGVPVHPQPKLNGPTNSPNRAVVT